MTETARVFPTLELAFAVRYGAYTPNQIYWDRAFQPPEELIVSAAVWCGHKFLKDYTLTEIIEAFKNDRVRYSTWEHTDGSVWVRAI